MTAGGRPGSGHVVRQLTVLKHVEADPETVFSFVSDTRNDPAWCPNVTAVTQISGDGVEVGAVFRFQQRVAMRGRTLTSDVNVEIVELKDRSIRWRVEDRFQIRDVQLKVDPDGDGSNVTQITSAMFKRPPGIARWFYPMLARRTFKDQFERLALHFA